jgi:hypothetical protein
MKHTEEEIIEIAKQVFEQVEYDFYYKDRIKAKYVENHELYSRGDITMVWVITADAQDEQFPHLTSYIQLLINDDDKTPFILNDFTGGRIPPLKIEKDNKDKYYISGPWLD